jgi:peptide chain release factor subunit 1
MPESTALNRYKFLRELEEIEKASGRGTELVSLYIPPEKQVFDVANYVRGEHAQSSNIKSASTRKHVTGALESILSRLRYYRQPPSNGLVMFVGHKQIGADQTEMVQYVLEPPEPVPTFIYRCDSHFFTQPLHDMLVEHDVYGLVVIDRSEATLGLLKGKRIEVIKNVHSLVPSKHRMGGQSARRFERLIEQAAHEFYKKVGDLMTEAFLDRKEIRGVLVGGPGYTKEYFIKGDYVHHEIMKKVLPTYIDVGDTDDYGLREMVERARSVLTGLDLMREKDLVQKLMLEVSKIDSGLAAYGEANVRHALDVGAVDMLLLSEGIRKSRAKLKCPSCSYENTETIDSAHGPGQCPKCGAQLSVMEAHDLIEELTATAEKTGTRVEMISKESEEGELLVRAFGGLAAILRYRVT